MKQLHIQNFVAHCLSPFYDDGDDGKIRQSIHSDRIDWNQIIRISSAHLVVPALYASFKRKALLPLLPRDLQEYLATLFQLNVERNQKLQQQLQNLLTALSQANIQVVLLKGAASLQTGLYDDNGERVMRDLDLLVEKQAMHAAVKRLFSLGYSYCNIDSLPTPPSDDQDDPIEVLQQRGLGYCHHIYPLCHPQAVASVELHIQPCEHLKHETFLPSKECFSDAEIWHRANCHTLSLEHRLLHNFYHTQIQDRNGLYGKINLMQLYEFVQLIYRNQDRINWSIIQQEIQRCGLNHHFYVYQQHAADYFHCPLPDHFILPTASRILLFRHRLLATSGSLRAIDSFVMFVVLKIARELSPARVRDKHRTTPIVFAYLKQATGIVAKLFRFGWLKETWKQLVYALRN